MEVIKHEAHSYFDVDDTLVMWGDKCFEPGEEKIRIVDPDCGEAVYLTPNRKHINLVKCHKSRGRRVTVWSAGGWAWAKAVIESLDLQDYVDVVQSKPLCYTDDLPADSWMDRIYLPEGRVTPDTPEWGHK